MELIEVMVSRLSLLLGERLEGLTVVGVSLFPERPLDSHEKLMPSFLGIGSVEEGVAGVAFAVVEEPQGIEGKLPDNPLVLGGIFICKIGGLPSGDFSSPLRMSDADVVEVVSAISSSRG